MVTNLASSITKAASKQTYYTIRFLVDRERVDDAYRAYGYFRWVDDVLDSDSGSASERMTFIERQKALLDSCYRGEPPRDVNFYEKMLVELVQHDQEKSNALRQAQDNGLQSYLHNMMLVMEFDARRRGSLISQVELNDYTRWLAIAVTEGLRHFVGHGEFAPLDETRYLAVSAAHIIHMLRDTYDDVQAGYFNIPREVLEVHSFGPRDLRSDAYRTWVKNRVELARQDFQAGHDYFRRAENLRHRLAGFTYMARFEWLLETFESEGFALRPQYGERKSMGTGLRMGWMIVSSMLNFSGEGALPQPGVAHPLDKA